MLKTIKALYKDGEFKPLESSELEDNTEVNLTISKVNPYLQFVGTIDKDEADEMIKVIEEEFENANLN